MNKQYNLMQNPLDQILSKQNFYFEAYSNNGTGWFTNTQGSYTAPIYPTVQIDISWDIPITTGAISGFRIIKTSAPGRIQHDVTISCMVYKYPDISGLMPQTIFGGSVTPTYGTEDAISVGYNKDTKIFTIYIFGKIITNFNGTNSPIGTNIKLQCTVTCDSSRIQTSPNATFNFGKSTFRYTSIANTYIGEYGIL